MTYSLRNNNTQGCYNNNVNILLRLTVYYSDIVIYLGEIQPCLPLLISLSGSKWSLLPGGIRDLAKRIHARVH